MKPGKLIQVKHDGYFFYESLYDAKGFPYLTNPNSFNWPMDLGTSIPKNTYVMFIGEELFPNEDMYKVLFLSKVGYVKKEIFDDVLPVEKEIPFLGTESIQRNIFVTFEHLYRPDSTPPTHLYQPDVTIQPIPSIVINPTTTAWTSTKIQIHIPKLTRYK